MDDKIRIPLAEAIGTAALVIGGPGTAIFATAGFFTKASPRSPSGRPSASSASHWRSG